ncbi:septum formation initiator family protein, partial [Escherichia coli]|nr:septum formation initiator family protein [Escherichia coli]
RRFPKGLTLLVPVVLVSLAVGYVNFRAYREYLDEQHQNVELERQIENATRQNIELQEEIYYLKNDPATIENEARRFGLVRP